MNQFIIESIEMLRVVQHEVFGTNAGDCPEPFADYDRACELAGMLRSAIELLERVVKA